MIGAIAWTWGAGALLAVAMLFGAARQRVRTSKGRWLARLCAALFLGAATFCALEAAAGLAR